jgi:hypothetical protein
MPSSVSTLADQSAHHGCDRLGHQLAAAAVGVETIVQPLGLAERQHVESVEVVQVRVTVGAQQAHGLGDMLAHLRQGQACATRNRLPARGRDWRDDQHGHVRAGVPDRRDEAEDRRHERPGVERALPVYVDPDASVITSGDVPPISRAINGSRWHCLPKPRHVRSRSSSRASRAGQVRDGDAAVRHWVMELPYVTIRLRRGRCRGRCRGRPRPCLAPGRLWNHPGRC